MGGLAAASQPKRGRILTTIWQAKCAHTTPWVSEGWRLGGWRPGCSVPEGTPLRLRTAQQHLRAATPNAPTENFQEVTSPPELIRCWFVLPLRVRTVSTEARHGGPRSARF